MDTKNCSVCENESVSRICSDCIPPNKVFCEKCFKDEHCGISTQNHTSLDIKYKRIILGPNNTRNAYGRENSLPSPNFSSGSFTFGSTDLNDERDRQVPETNHDTAPDLPISEITEAANAVSTFPLSHYSIFSSQFSVETDDPCILFESAVRQFESIVSLGTALRIEGPMESLRCQIVTFIGSPLKTESLPNILLLKDNKIKFPVGTNRTKSPICLMLYDTEHQLLILEAQNLDRANEQYIDQQNMLIKLLLALSDVIVFSENRRKRDLIRIHETMQTCKTRFNQLFTKVLKAQPERLAPGIIYLQTARSLIEDDLSTSIKNEIGKEDPLYTSCTKTIFFDRNKNNENEEFISGLKMVLEYNSQCRNRHSLEDILLCIDNCKESLSIIKEDISSNDIPNSWFFCTNFCEICSAKCEKFFGHSDSHDNHSDCRPMSDNEVYFCKMCIDMNNGQIGLPLVLRPMSKEENFFMNVISYPFRRGIVECPQHGKIYDNNWVYNYYQDTFLSKHVHKWPGQSLISQNVYPVGQLLLDKVKEISQPAAKLFIHSTEYLSDVVKPEDWKPTREACNCHCCNESFTMTMSKHHCRNCKQVICSSCCKTHRGLLLCKKCYDTDSFTNATEESKGITVLNIFRDSYIISSKFVRRNVSSFCRPDYWEDDDKVIRCYICTEEFHCEINPIHHCRACGRCVCDKCSLEKRTVEWRCISDPNRICDRCIETKHWKSNN